MLEKELLPEDLDVYRNSLRMNSDQFKYILRLIEHKIQRQNTSFWEAISATSR